jgi:hypothetical protein
MINPKDLPIVLRHIDPNSVFMVQDNSDGTDTFIASWDSANPQPTQADVDAAEPAAMEAHNKRMLGLYAEEQSLKHGASMIDPNSATFETVADATGNLDEIRQQQGRSRAKMHNGKARGADGGNSSVVGSKARNNAAQAIEESLGVALVDVELDIASGLITTKAEIDARIYSVNLTY